MRSPRPPRPLPAHYSLAVLRMCASESSACSCPDDFFFSCHGDPHYCTHTVTGICFPPLPLFCSRHAILSAPSAPCTGLIWSGGGGWALGLVVARKHQEIRQEVREANLGKWKVRTFQHLIDSRCYMLFGGSAWTFDLYPCLVQCPNLTPDVLSLCPGQPGMRGKKLAQWCLCTTQRGGAAGDEGSQGEELCVVERKMLDGEVIMSGSKLAWLTHRKSEVTNDLCK